MSFQSQWKYDWTVKGMANARWSHIVITYEVPGIGKVVARCDEAIEEATEEGGRFFTLRQIPRLQNGLTFTKATAQNPWPLYHPLTGVPLPPEVRAAMAGAISAGVCTDEIMQTLIFSRLHGTALAEEEAAWTAAQTPPPDPDPADLPPADPPEEPAP